MFCKSCGASIPDDSILCPQCGIRLNYGQSEQATTPTQATAPSQAIQPVQTAAPAVEHKMKWYKFLAYFAVWMAGLSNLVRAVQYFTEYSQEVTYTYWGGATKTVTVNLYDHAESSLKTVGVFCGLLSIAGAVIAVMAGLALIKKKKDSFKLVTILWAVSTMTGVIFAGAAISMVTDIEFTNAGSTIVLSIIFLVVMIFVNKKYFDNRKDVFVN